jgi:hypothetical protein
VKWVAGGLLAALAVAAVVVDVALHRAEPFLRARIVEELARSLSRPRGAGQLSRFAGEWAVGRGQGAAHLAAGAGRWGVTVPQGQGEPLIRLDEFRFHAPLRYRSRASRFTFRWSS